MISYNNNPKITMLFWSKNQFFNSLITISCRILSHMIIMIIHNLSCNRDKLLIHVFIIHHHPILLNTFRLWSKCFIKDNIYFTIDEKVKIIEHLVNGISNKDLSKTKQQLLCKSITKFKNTCKECTFIFCNSDATIWFSRSLENCYKQIQLNIIPHLYHFIVL